jgi:hypothetical protein
MKKLILFAAVAGLGLVSASPPAPKGGPDKPDEAYPPCSRTVTDSCMQRQQGRATARRHYAAHAARRAPGPAPARTAAATPRAPAAAAAPHAPVRVAARIRRAGERG